MNSCSTSEEDISLKLLELMPAQKTGINFRNIVPETLNENIFSYVNYYNGGGVAIGDINNDGLVDIYFSSNHDSGKLYLNKGGFKFKDITIGSGLDTLSGWKTGVVMVDINQDGFLDIYICRSGMFETKGRANLLYINNGDQTFSEKGKEYGLNDTGFSTQAAFFDYDMDGDLDMYLLNHAIRPIRTITNDYNDNDIDPNTGDKIYNNENGHFTEIKNFIGIKQSKLGDGLGVSIGDFNNDLYPDIYICNDFVGRDYLYFNNGDGTFKEEALKLMNHISLLSMGADIADFDNDGWQDLFVLDMRSSTNYSRKTNMGSMDAKTFNDMAFLGGHHQYMINTMQLNNGGESFSEIASLLGVTSTDWSWAPLFVDLDNDGLKDLFITNGMKKNTNNKDYDTYREKRTNQELARTNPDFVTMVTELLNKIPSEKVPNHVYRNLDGLSFEQKNNDWGINLPSFSNGAAYADLDNDGDMDLIINNIDQVAHIYRNNATTLNKNHFVRVKLKGSSTNLNGIGANIMIQSEGEKQYLEQHNSRGFQSSIDNILHFGLGQSDLIEMLRVKWPDGKISEITDIPADQTILVKYINAEEPSEIIESKTLLFTDVTESYGLQHKHFENNYDDFKNEVLLPHKMSTFGPALAVGDINNDGLDDFFIGGSMNHDGAIYIQKENKSFTKTIQKDISIDRFHEDIDALFFDADDDGDQDLYIVSGGNEMTVGNIYYEDRLYLNDGKGNFSRSPNALPSLKSSGGVVRANDFDNDGDLDLFIGGRLLPNQYPLSGRSYLLENKNGIFKDITAENTKDLLYPGMVTDALWSDYNNDGTKDLILVGEWMPITIFLNNNGKLIKLENDSTLSKSNGWWFSIAEGDVNMDGKMDYIVGNLGENYKYKAKPEAPFRLFSNDFDNNGSLDIVLSYYENDTLYPLRGKQCSSQQIPDLKKKFKDYNSFGLAALEDVYEPSSLEESILLEAKTFASSILINKENGFELLKLPKIAQIAAVFGIVYDDFDNDGLGDIVLAGNLYNSEVETPRNDAGQGLFLKGDGKGGFLPVRGYDSGLIIPGDVKSLKPITLGIGSSARNAVLAGINDDFVRLNSSNLPNRYN